MQVVPKNSVDAAADHLQRAREARAKYEATTDPIARETMKTVVDVWEFLATQALKKAANG